MRLTRTNASELRKTRDFTITMYHVDYEETNMSKNSNRSNTRRNSAQTQTETPAPAPAPAPTPAPTPAKPEPLFSLASIALYDAALDKACSAPHPNFIAKMKPDTKQLYEDIRGASCAAFDEAKKSAKSESDRVKKTVIFTVKRLGQMSKRHAVTYLKDLVASAAFAAHMHCVEMERARSSDPISARDIGLLDSMLDAEPGDLHQHSAEREPYAGEDEVTAPFGDEHEVADAIHSVQTWIGAITTAVFSADDAAYWGIDGTFPIGTKKKDDGSYVNITDFYEYRAEQDRRWKEKQRVLTVDTSMLDKLLAIQ